jgi:hypothetical protein
LAPSRERNSSGRLHDGEAAAQIASSTWAVSIEPCERIADPFNGHIDEFRISHVQRSDGWIAR